MKKCLFKVFVLSTIVCLISCQNFLDGSKLKDLLEKEVFIASSIRPEITSVSPTYVEGGVYSDSNIIINFSKKMEKKYFSDFSYISITDSSGVNLIEHYFPPKLSDDGMTLTIAYNPSNSINIPEGTIKTVKVRLSSEISDYETIPLKNDYTWTFNLNSKTDDKAPEFLTGTVLTGNTAVPMAEGTFDSILTSIGADNFFTDTYHCNSVNINLNTFDADSGVSKLTVKETLLYSVDGLNVKDKNNFSETTFTAFTQNDKNYTLNETYDFSKKIADGIVELTLTIEDRCGNKAEKTFAMVKDTEVTATYDNVFGDDSNPDVSKTESNHYFEIRNIESKAWATWKGHEYKDNISFEYLELLDADYNHLENGTKLDLNRHYYRFDSINNKNTYYIKAVFKDQCGNIAEKYIHINSAPIVSSIYKDWESSDFNRIFISDSNSIIADHSKAVYSSDCENYEEQISFFEFKFPNTTKSAYFKFLYNSPFEFSTYSDEYTCFTGASSWKTDVSKLLSCTLNPSDDLKNKGYELCVTVLDDSFLTKENASFIVSTPVSKFSKVFRLTGKTTVINLSMDDINECINCKYDEPYNAEEKQIGVGIIYYDNDKLYNSGIDYLTEWFIENQWYVISIQNILDEQLSENDFIRPSISPYSYITPVSQDNYNHFAVKVRISDAPNTPESLLNEERTMPVKIYWTPEPATSLNEREIRLLDYIETNLFVTEIDSETKIVDGYVALDSIISQMKVLNKEDFDLYFEIEDRAGNTSYAQSTYYSVGKDYTIEYDDNDGFIKKIWLDDKPDYEFRIDFKNFSDLIINSDTGPHQQYILSVDNTDLRTSNNETRNDQDETPWYPKSTVYEKDALTAKFLCAKTFLYASKLRNDDISDILTLDDEYSYYFYTKKVTCNVKNIIQSGKLLTVLHDQPVFVHTVASPVNFGNDIRDWENWAGKSCKLNEKVISVSTEGSVQFDNYEYPALTDIPEGWYYAAIIYFADNSSTIGTVFQN